MGIDISPNDNYEDTGDYEDDRSPPPGIYDATVLYGKEYPRRTDENGKTKELAWNLKLGVKVPAQHGLPGFSATHWVWISRSYRRQWGPMVQALFGDVIEQAKRSGEVINVGIDQAFGRQMRVHLEWSTKNPNELFLTQIEPITNRPASRAQTYGSSSGSPMADAMGVPNNELPF